MVNLRKAAKGQMCQIRIPGYCNHNPETSVLAHYRLAGTCGTATKPHDMQAAIAKAPMLSGGLVQRLAQPGVVGPAVLIAHR